MESVKLQLLIQIKLILKQNDIMVLYRGIHGFKVKKDCKFIEIKQGPYFIKLDKKLLLN